jgi:DnaK suppressor protein
MLDHLIIDALRDQIRRQRNEINEILQGSKQSWQRLNEPETELEETASKMNLSQGLAQLEANGRRQLQQLDDALERIDRGDFGDCQECGVPIAVKRLKAIPWTRLCIRCAQAQERHPEADATALETVSAGTGGRIDEEMCEIIDDALKEDGRIELEELEIACEDGVIYLDGLLPGEDSRELLLEIVSDTLGYDQVVDRVRIDRQPWTRRDPTSDAPPDETPDKEVPLEEEEEEDTDPFTAMQEGESIPPPDRLSWEEGQE